jgi:hypothetical protein
MNHFWATPSLAGSRLHLFYLVESRVCPKKSEPFKKELKDDDTVETDFIGASEDDCQRWLRENQYQNPHIEQDMLFIADACSAQDDTVLAKVYNEQGHEYEESEEEVPPKRNTWYEFRIDFKDAEPFHVDLYYNRAPELMRAYFLHKEEASDEHGVFSVAKARTLSINLT